MLGILIDALVLVIALHFAGREEASEFGKLLLVSVALAAVNFGISLLLVKSMGFLVLAPMVAANTVLLKVWYGLTWPKSLLVVGVLFAVKVAYTLVFASMRG